MLQHVTPISDEVINQGPILSNDDWLFLSAPFEDKDIKEALFHIGDQKAQGPDGYTTVFFKSNWDIVKVDFIAVVQEFFNSGKLLKQYNHATIGRIPNSKHDPTHNDFRPISRCNVVHKTITKLMANRLVVIIPKLIDLAQGAFIEERLMNENIILAQQLIRRYGRKTSTPRCMMMVDIKKKAFNSLSWDFLMNILKRLGFPSNMVYFIKW